MNFRLVFALLPLLSGPQALAAAEVANLNQLEGKVLVDQGQGFMPAAIGASLNAGDRVFVGKGGKAVLSYGTCLFKISKSTVYTLSKDVPCNVGQKFPGLRGVIIQPAAAPATLSAPPPETIPIIGGAIIAGGILILTQHSVSKP